jgi:hypothetical protein
MERFPWHRAALTALAIGIGLLVNSLYPGGLAFAVVAFLGAAVGFAATRARVTGMALLVGTAAVAVNRLAPYR